MKYQVWFKWYDPDEPKTFDDIDAPLEEKTYDTPEEAQERINRQHSDGRYHAEEYYIKTV